MLGWLKRLVESPGALNEEYLRKALACRASGDLAGAQAAYRNALALQPGDTRTRVKLGALCTKTGHLDEAERLLRRAIEEAPDYAEAYIRLGDLLLERLSSQEAIAAYEEAVRREPAWSRAHVALGWGLETSGDLDGGLQAYERAVALDPGSVDGHVSRGAAWLAREQFGRGWDEYEWRLRSQSDHASARFRIPDWDGASLAGRTILFYREQGIGDQIMYASCIPDLMREARGCVIDCEPRLVGLFRRSFPGAFVHGGSHSAADDWLEGLAVDVKISAVSAARHLRRSPDHFPAHRGYLQAEPQKIAEWCRRLEALGPGPKVGISWRGGVQRTGRAWRSLAPADFAPLLRTPGVHFVNLQYDADAAELDRIRHHGDVEVHHWPEALVDYDETAALLCALHLTISVCTSVVHLAGALGRPVWVLAPVKPDARYGLRGPTMRWYPSARMFRQSRFGDWESVIGEVSGELRHLATP
jgi:tetratricopeptide (TPR) repeat protein